MSLAYYGLSFNPFDKQMVQEKDRFLSRDMTEMTQRLDYLKDARGIGVFTARPGMGKSFCLRCFAKSLNPNLYHMCFLASNFPHFHRYDSLKSALYIHAVSKNINTFPKNQGRIRAAIAVEILDFTVMYR